MCITNGNIKNNVFLYECKKNILKHTELYCQWNYVYKSYTIASLCYLYINTSYSSVPSM